MRIAVVGLGSAGCDIHLPALADIPGHEVVAGFDPDPARRSLAAATWRIPTVESFDDLLSRHHPDVVLLGSPPDTHFAYATSALAAGAHVLCEKPLASSVAEADQLVAAANANGRQIAVNHEFRELPIFRAVRDAVRGGETGPPTFVQVWQLMDRPPASEPGWRGRLRYRTLYEAGIHLVDLAIALFAEVPRAVTATVSDGGQGGPARDGLVVATLEFSTGRLAHVIQSRFCKGPQQYLEVRAETAGASFRASFGGRARLTAGMLRSPRPSVRLEVGTSGIAWREEGVSRRLLARNPKRPLVAATREVIVRTLDAFAQGERPPTDVSLARDILLVIAACYRSAELGTRIELAHADERVRTLAMADPK